MVKSNCLYLEWFDDVNGRVVIESTDFKVSLSDHTWLMTAEEVAEKFVEGVIKKTYHILPGEAKFIWWMNRLFPSLVQIIIDRDYQKAREKVGKA